jgi:hypothetical protein
VPYLTPTPWFVAVKGAVIPDFKPKLSTQSHVCPGSFISHIDQKCSYITKYHE